MVPPASSSQHELFSAAQVIRRVAELIEDIRDRSSFARVCRGTYGPVTKALYRQIYIDSTTQGSRAFPHVGLLNARNCAHNRREVALLKTFKHNPHLSKAVLRLHIRAAHLEDMSRILAACPGVITLRLEVDITISFQNTRELAHPPFPVIPRTVKRLEVICNNQIELTMEVFVMSFSNATSLRALSLDTTVETAQTILASCGRQLTSLRLSGLGSFISNTIYADLFCHVPHLISLRLIAVVDHRIEDIPFPPLLQHLVIDVTEFEVVERIFELLATDPSWCPRLTTLVRFRSIGNTDFRYDTETATVSDLRLKRFHANCLRAYAIRSRAWFWRGDASECKRIIATYGQFYYFYKSKMNTLFYNNTHGHHLNEA